MTFLFNIWNFHILIWPYVHLQGVFSCSKDIWATIFWSVVFGTKLEWRASINIFDNIVFMFEMRRSSFFLIIFLKLFKYFSGFREALGQSRDQRFIHLRHSKLCRMVILLRWNAFNSLWTYIFECVFVLFESLSQELESDVRLTLKAM